MKNHQVSDAEADVSVVYTCTKSFLQILIPLPSKNYPQSPPPGIQNPTPSSLLITTLPLSLTTSPSPPLEVGLLLISTSMGVNFLSPSPSACPSPPCKRLMALGIATSAAGPSVAVRGVAVCSWCVEEDDELMYAEFEEVGLETALEYPSTWPRFLVGSIKSRTRRFSSFVSEKISKSFR